MSGLPAGVFTALPASSDKRCVCSGSGFRGEVSPRGRLPESSASTEGILSLPGSSGFSLTYHLSVLSA